MYSSFRPIIWKRWPNKPIDFNEFLPLTYNISWVPICNKAMMVVSTKTHFKKILVRLCARLLILNGSNGAYIKNTKYGIDKIAGREMIPFRIYRYLLDNMKQKLKWWKSWNDIVWKFILTKCKQRGKNDPLYYVQYNCRHFGILQGICTW